MEGVLKKARLVCSVLADLETNLAIFRVSAEESGKEPRDPIASARALMS
jgi:hypothetical protein